MIHPHATLLRINDDVGYGVFATSPIPRGTITWVLDGMDRVFEPHEVRELEPEYRALLERYTWLDSSGRRTLCWDFARFVNHACEPNTATAGAFDFDVAIRDIETGDEITCDYAVLNLEQPFRCACSSSNCRHVIRPDDFEVSAHALDERVRVVFPEIPRVAQPLERWIANRNEVRFALRNPSLLGSIRAHRYAVGRETYREHREAVAQPREESR